MARTLFFGRLIGTIILLMFTDLLLAQSAHNAADSCGCAAVMKEKKVRSFYANEKADAVIRSFTGMFRNALTITARPYACDNGPFLCAALCDVGERRPDMFIFYNPKVMGNFQKASGNSDNFLLAHEIAHHVLGHTTEAYYLGEDQQAYINDSSTTRKKYIARLFSPKVFKERKKYVLDLPRKHIHEFEADALALWMAMTKGLTVNDIDEVLAIIPKVLSNYDPLFNKWEDTYTHPSPVNRERFLKSLLPDLSNRIAEGKGFENLSDGHSPFYEKAKAFYAFQLLTASDKRAQEFTKIEKAIRDSLNKSNNIYAEIILGGIYQSPGFKKSGVEVPAKSYLGWTGGLKLGIRPWYRKHRFEADIKIGHNEFSTLVEENNQYYLLEKFKKTLLYFQPRYVFSYTSKMHQFHPRSQKWMAAAGVSMQQPLKDTYFNYATGTGGYAASRPSIAPTIGLGYGLSNWNSKKGHFNFWIHYLPQEQRFTDKAVHAQGKYLLHTFQAEVSFRLW